MNPGIPTSHVRGWTDYADHTTTPHSLVHHWSGEWQNLAGDILTYNLSYRSAAPIEREGNGEEPSDWQDPAGEIVRYDSSRLSPAPTEAIALREGPTTDQLEVAGAIITHSQVAEILGSFPR